MTPNNIVRLAKLENRDFLVVTDHHSVGNVAVCQQVGQVWGVTVLAGMELETREGVHLLAVFPDVRSGQKVEEWVRSRLAHIPNRPRVFGEQLLFAADDTVVEVEQLLLSQSLPDPLETVTSRLHAAEALVIAAHVERRSHGLFGQLGMVPPGFVPNGWEIGQGENLATLQQRVDFPPSAAWVKGSDAHSLTELVSPWVTILHAKDPVFDEMAKGLRNDCGRWTAVHKLGW